VNKHQKYAMVQRAIEKRGFAKQAEWPELLLAIVDAAEELARRIVEEQRHGR